MIDLGGKYSKFSSDLVFQHYNQAISVLNPLLGAQSLSAGAPKNSRLSTASIQRHLPDHCQRTTITNLIDTNNTVYGIVTDNNAVMAAAKYSSDAIKFFAGYEYIWMNNPRTRWALAPRTRAVIS